jgi:hypothetical protein
MINQLLTPLSSAFVKLVKHWKPTKKVQEIILVTFIIVFFVQLLVVTNMILVMTVLKIIYK